MTNLLETKMNEAAQATKIVQLKRLLRQAQELGRETEVRIKELRQSLLNRTQEVLRLNDSLRSQELLLGESGAAAAAEIERLKAANALFESANQKLSAEISSLLFSLQVEELAHVAAKQELDRIPRWIRRLFRAKDQAVRSSAGEDHGGGASSGA